METQAIDKQTPNHITKQQPPHADSTSLPVGAIPIPLDDYPYFAWGMSEADLTVAARRFGQWSSANKKAQQISMLPSIFFRGLIPNEYDQTNSHILKLGGIPVDERLRWNNGIEKPSDSEEIPKISKDTIQQFIRDAEETSGMNVDQYKAAIDSGIVKNYSIVHLRKWERMVKMLEEME